MRILHVGNVHLVDPLRAQGHEVIAAFEEYPALAVPGVPFDVRALLRRLPFALARLLLELVPVAIFAGVANLLAAMLAAGTPRLVILVLVNAYVVYRVVLAIGEMLVSPRLGRLRLFYADDIHAENAIGWVRRLAGVAVFGSAAAEIGLLLGLDPRAHRILVRLVGLIIAELLMRLSLLLLIPDENNAHSISPENAKTG